MLGKRGVASSIVLLALARAGSDLPLESAQLIPRAEWSDILASRDSFQKLEAAELGSPEDIGSPFVINGETYSQFKSQSAAKRRLEQT